jgi:hypothetical protein
MALPFAVVLFAALANCSAPHAAATASPVAAASPADTGAATQAPPAPAAEAWRFTLPVVGNPTSIVRANDLLILTGPFGLIALDGESGAVRWRQTEPLGMAVVSDSVLFTATPRGGLEARSIRDGGVMWRNPQVCEMKPHGRFPPVGGASVVLTHGGDVVVGCQFGGVARLGARTGETLASTLAFEMDTVTSIVPLGPCAYGVSGYGSGAHLRTYAGIVGCKTLDTILPLQEDNTILGAVGGEAIVNDMCCMGRSGVYRPATIYRVSLTTHVRTPEVDLTPEPDRYPIDTRPLGQGSTAVLGGDTLYLFVDHDAYRYGDPRFLAATPQRVADDLRNAPDAIGDSTALAQIQSDDGTLRYALLRLSSKSITTLWSAPEAPNDTTSASWLGIAPTAIGYSLPGGGDAYLRLHELRVLVSPDAACRSAHADEHLLIEICPTKQLVGNTFVEYLAAYRWP